MEVFRRTDVGRKAKKPDTKTTKNDIIKHIWNNLTLDKSSIEIPFDIGNNSVRPNNSE